MPAERDADAILAQGNVVGLADVIEREQFHHQMMHAALAGLDQRKAVMARIDVEEIGAERLFDVVGKAEAEQIDIERHHGFDVFDHQHRMAEPERSGPESRYRTSRAKWRLVGLGAMKALQAVAGGIMKRDQRLDAPRIGKRRWLGGDCYARVLQSRRERIERTGILNLPAEEMGAFANRTVDDDALLAVIHPEGQ